MSTEPTPFWVDRDYDCAHASDGISRYGAYLRDATFEPWTDNDHAVEWAAFAWRRATGPVMSLGYVRYHPRVLGARLERTTVRGPAIIGAGAQLSDCYVGPYTAIGERCVISGAEIEHSILLEGCCVEGLDGRMESSLLGREVRIRRGERQPRAYRFMVGDSSDISIP